MKILSPSIAVFAMLLIGITSRSEAMEGHQAPGKNTLSDSLFSPGATAPKGKEITLQSGTNLQFELVEDVNSDRVEKGDKVKFKVLSEVKEDGEAVINMGARAEGKVVEVTPSKGNGLPGKVAVQPTAAYAVDGTRVPIAPNRIEDKGEKKTWMRWVGWGGLVLFWWTIVGLLFPLFLLFHGEEGIARGGETVYATVAQDTEVEVD